MTGVRVGDSRSSRSTSPTAEDALALARQLATDCHFFKVGSELFTAAGPTIVRELREKLGADVFLDLKFHDIPTPSPAPCGARLGLGARLVTVHASGGPAMLDAAQEASTGRVRGAGVTVLTSLDAASAGAAWGRPNALDVEAEVMRLAGDAAAAGLHGIVCSGEEASAVRARIRRPAGAACAGHPAGGRGRARPASGGDAARGAAGRGALCGAGPDGDGGGRPEGGDRNGAGGSGGGCGGRDAGGGTESNVSLGVASCLPARLC